MDSRERLIQQLAADALNVWREHVLVLADALEEQGLHHESKWVRRDLADPIVVRPVDHQATRRKTVDAASLSRTLIRLAKPPFYLARSASPLKLVLQVWARERPKRRVVGAFRPTKVGGVWQPETITVRHGPDDCLSTTLELSSEIITGAVGDWKSLSAHDKESRTKDGRERAAQRRAGRARAMAALEALSPSTPMPNGGGDV